MLADAVAGSAQLHAISRPVAVGAASLCCRTHAHSACARANPAALRLCEPARAAQLRCEVPDSRESTGTKHRIRCPRPSHAFSAASHHPCAGAHHVNPAASATQTRRFAAKPRQNNDVVPDGMALALCPAIGSTAIRRNTQQAQQRATPITKLLDNGVPRADRRSVSRDAFSFSGKKMANKATRIDLFSLRTPPMRAFHLTWMAFFVCFFAWFACAPLMPLIKKRVRPLRRPGREHQHRRRRGDDPRAARRSARCATASVRARSTPALLAGRRDSGARRRALDRLRELPLVPPRDRRDRRELRHHAVPHLGDVRAERRRHGERDDRRLGQRGRGRVAGAGAAAGGGVRSRSARASIGMARRAASCRASRCRSWPSSTGAIRRTARKATSRTCAHAASPSTAARRAAGRASARPARTIACGCCSSRMPRASASKCSSTTSRRSTTSITSSSR